MILSDDYRARLVEKVGDDICSQLRGLSVPFGDFFDIDRKDPTIITFIPKNAITGAEDSVQVFEDLEFRAKKCNKIRLSRVLRLLKLPNKVVSELTVKWNVKNVLTFQIFEEAGDLYKLAGENGLASCMTTHHKKVGEFYSKLPVKGIGFFIEGAFVARALLWEGVNFSKIPASRYRNTKDGADFSADFLDRIYTKASTGVDLGVLSAVEKLAEVQGWVMKEKQKAGSVEYFNLKGENFEALAQVFSKTPVDFDKFVPYLDTFCGLSPSKNSVFNDLSASYRGIRTDGRVAGYNDGHTCEHCGAWVDMQDISRVVVGYVTYCDRQCALEDGVPEHHLGDF